MDRRLTAPRDHDVGCQPTTFYLNYVGDDFSGSMAGRGSVRAGRARDVSDLATIGGMGSAAPIGRRSTAEYSSRWGNNGATRPTNPSEVRATRHPDGNAYAVFMRNNGNRMFDLDLGIADAAAPSLGAVVVPTSGVAGTPVAVAADATDVVGPVMLTWSFGDAGPTMTGPDAEHVYAEAGAYTITVKATDASGQSTVQTRSIAIAPAPVLPDTTTTTIMGTNPGGGGSLNVPGPVAIVSNTACDRAVGRLSVEASTTRRA